MIDFEKSKFRRREPLAEALGSPDRKRRYNQRMFTTIAPRYDLITRLLSYGRDQRWKDDLVRHAAVEQGEAALDVACGTGDIARRLRDAGARVTGVDLTPAMLARAGARPPGSSMRGSEAAVGRAGVRDDEVRPIRYVAGDIGALPLRSTSFDVITAGYALRNLPDLDVGLRELARALRPGGRLLSLDFNRPRSTAVRVAYEGYLWVVGSTLGLLLHRDPDTYRYIVASLRRYPTADGVVERLRDAGFVEVRWQPVLGGLMAFHFARKPRGR